MTNVISAGAQQDMSAMTREQVEQAIREMERLREASRLADELDEQRRNANDYHRLWRELRPYVQAKRLTTD